jgi:hypothetical protein
VAKGVDQALELDWLGWAAGTSMRGTRRERHGTSFIAVGDRARNEFDTWRSAERPSSIDHDGQAVSVVMRRIGRR